MVSSFRNNSAVRRIICAACLPLVLLPGCRPTDQKPASIHAAEVACREIAIPSIPRGADATAKRTAQLRAVLLDTDIDPACLGAQLFRGPDSAAEQAVIIALMQSDPQPLVRSRGAAALGGVKGDPRPAFSALYTAHSGEQDDLVAAAQLDSIADLLPARAALQWDEQDGLTIAGVIALVGAGGKPTGDLDAVATPAAGAKPGGDAGAVPTPADGSEVAGPDPAPEHAAPDPATAGADLERMAAARSVMVERGHVLVVLGDVLEQAAVANKAHRDDATIAARGAAPTTGAAAATPAIWDAYELALTSLLADTRHVASDDVDWRAPALAKLADVLRNGRLNPKPRAELADALVRSVAYPATPVRVAAVRAMGALTEAAALAKRSQAPGAAPMLEPSTSAGMHAAVVRAARDPSPLVRTAAANALGTFAVHAGRSTEALKPLLKDIDTQVRTSAEQALARRAAPAEPVVPSGQAQPAASSSGSDTATAVTP